eukprot:3797170-Rhodomonas_salina.2
MGAWGCNRRRFGGSAERQAEKKGVRGTWRTHGSRTRAGDALPRRGCIAMHIATFAPTPDVSPRHRRPKHMHRAGL